MDVYGWPYEAINYPISDDAHLRADNKDMTNCANQGVKAGDEVVIGRELDDATWAQSIAHARPGRWIAQRWFETLDNLNYGVFLIGGEASGLYVRRQAGGWFSVFHEPAAPATPVSRAHSALAAHALAG